jgi:hypothetical protein
VVVSTKKIYFFKKSRPEAYALVDGLGNPVKFILSPGNESDITHAEELTKFFYIIFPF